jgi:hypothetical protein
MSRMCAMREHDGRDEHLDEAHEDLADGLERHAPLGLRPPHEDPERDRRQHLQVERRLLRRRLLFGFFLTFFFRRRGFGLAHHM